MVVNAPSRPTVVDLAYGRVEMTGHRSTDVTGLLDAVDTSTTVIDGARRYSHQAWQGVWQRLGLPEQGSSGPVPLIIGHPSTWGRTRASVLARSVADFGDLVTLLPRAALVARSHADSTVGRCVVVETTHRPAPSTDPARATTIPWDISRMRRVSGCWEIEAAEILDPDGDDAGSRIEQLIDDSVEAVFVDGADSDSVDRAVELVAEHALAGRVVAVDRDLIRRFGGWIDTDDPVAASPLAPVATAETDTSPAPRRWIWAAAGLAVAVALIAAVVGIVQHDRGQGGTPVRTDQMVAVGRTEITVPNGWRRSDLPDEQKNPGPDDELTRTVFADPDNGRRMMVVQSELRSGSTLESVSTSLRNKIRQRGDDVVSEFSPSTQFMGRTVISYREAPASGSAIRWYVLVEHGLQVSVGCQAGTGGESVDGPCGRAVESMRIEPR